MLKSHMKNPNWTFDTSRCPGFKRHEVIDRVEREELIHHTEHWHVRTPTRYALVNITGLAEEAIARSGLWDGQALISAMHITAGVYINDAESGLLQDLAAWFERLAPAKPDYLHHQTGEDNADAHLKSLLTHHMVTVPITRGELDFGTWQQIFYAEFDGARDKRILIKLMGLRASP